MLGNHPGVAGSCDGIALAGAVKEIPHPLSEFGRRIECRNLATEREIPLQPWRDFRQQKAPCSRHLESPRLDLTLMPQVTRILARPREIQRNTRCPIDLWNLGCIDHAFVRAMAEA